MICAQIDANLGYRTISDRVETVAEKLIYIDPWDAKVDHAFKTTCQWLTLPATTEDSGL
jgi:hypothetical protein